MSHSSHIDHKHPAGAPASGATANTPVHTLIAQGNPSKQPEPPLFDQAPTVVFRGKSFRLKGRITMREVDSVLRNQ